MAQPFMLLVILILLSMKFSFLLAFVFISICCHGEIPYSERRNVVTETDGLYGFMYKGLINVLPQYSQTVALGDNRPCFLAKFNGKWGLVDIYNRPIIPFKFSAIKADSEISPQKSRNIVLDSIYVAEIGTVLPQITLPYSPEYNKFTDNTPAILVVKEENPESHSEGWRFIDFSGKAITPVYYDNAAGFKIYNDKKGKNFIYLADVSRNNLWGAIDLNGEEVIPVKYKSPINQKNKDLKKLLKKDYSSSDKARKKELEILVPKEGVCSNLWIQDSVPTVRIEKVGGNIVKAKAKKKSKKRSKSQRTPIQYRLYLNDTLAIDDSFDEVAAQQNDLIRVRKKDKWGVYKVGRGMYLPCEFSLIEPFDQYGLTKCVIDGVEVKFSAYGAHSTCGYDLEDIFYRADSSYQKTKDIGATGPIFEELLDALSFFDDQRLRLSYQSNQMNDYFSMKREREDPVYAQHMQNLREQKRIEEQKRLAEEAKKKEKKSGSSFLGMLGELASIAGDVIETTGNIAGKSSTSELGSSLSYLGKSVEAVSKGTEMPSAPSIQSSSASSSDSDVNGSNENYSNISELENQIKVLDERIKENREQAAQLARQRSKTYAQNQRDMESGAKMPKYADITKNDPYSSARRRAKTRAAAGAKSHDKLRSIDSQLDRLNQEFEKLSIQRYNLINKFDETSNNNDFEEGGSGSKNKKSKGKSQEYYQREYDSHAKLAEMLYKSLTATGYSIKKDGKDVEGSANGGWGVVKYSAVADKLLKHQLKMRRIRQSAAAHKYILKQSEYETVKVSM